MLAATSQAVNCPSLISSCRRALTTEASRVFSPVIFSQAARNPTFASCRAGTLSGSIESSFQGTRFAEILTPLKRRSFSVASTRAMAASADLEVFGKAVPFTGQPSARRGDCPFSQRTYLDLEEKKLAYKGTFVQEGENDSKPDWFMKNNPSGLMPVLRDGDEWIQDSDKIFEHLESKFPEPALKPSDSVKQVGQDIFPNFMGWLQEKNPNAADKKSEFELELKSFDQHIKQKGPYIDGDKMTDADLSVAPKLMHARVALKYWYGYEFPAELTAVREYSNRMEERESFKKTKPSEDLIIQGWGMKMELQKTPAASGP